MTRGANESVEPIQLRRHRRRLRRRRGACSGRRDSSRRGTASTSDSRPPTSPSTAASGPASCCCRWPGATGSRDLNGIGWGRGIVLTFFGGPGIAFVSYSGFPLVPLGHGGIIQPSTAALLGLVLATVVLHERLPAKRVTGALVIVAGLVVIGGEAITTIGVHGVAGDLLFVLAGTFFATFGMFLRKWRVVPTRAMIVTSVAVARHPADLWRAGRVRPHDRAGALGESAAGRPAGPAGRARRDLPVHPLRRAARRRAGGGVSDPGAALRAADRLDRAGHRCRACCN